MTENSKTVTGGSIASRVTEEKETGAASIIVELSKSRIIVRHGSSPKTILLKRKVTRGAWKFIWRALESVQ